MKKRFGIIFLLVIFSIAVPSKAFSLDREYNFFDLGFLDPGSDEAGPLFAIPHGINESAQVVGQTGILPQQDSPFFWQANSMSSVGLPSTPNTIVRAWASDINDSGQIVGVYQEPIQPQTNNEFGFFRSNNTSVSIQDFSPKKVSNDGTAIGSFTGGANFGQTGYWKNGNSSVLPFAFAADINNSNEVVGDASFSSGLQGAVLKNNQLDQLSPLSGHTSTSALAVNDLGEVVGWSFSASDSKHLVKWNSGVLSDLGIEPVKDFQIFAFNNAEQIVGTAPADTGSYAALWEKGEFSDLNLYLKPGSKWHLASALDVNELGQIIGFGYADDSPGQRAYLLSPVVTPEPASCSLFFLGGAALWARRRRGLIRKR